MESPWTHESKYGVQNTMWRVHCVLLGVNICWSIYGYMALEDMVKDHSDSEKGNPLPPHRLLFTITSKGSFICIIIRNTKRK